MVVDTLGLILALFVQGAEVQDRDGARIVLVRLKGVFPQIQHVWADRGYRGALIAWVATFFGAVLEIVQPAEGQKGFQVQPRRWVVERTFGWWGKYRRLSKDYEDSPRSSEAMIYLAMIHLMVRRLSRVT